MTMVPPTEAHRLLLAHVRGRPASILARRMKAPERTVHGWLEGRVPSWHYRAALAKLLGIEWPLWFRPPSASEEVVSPAPDGGSDAGSVTGP
jgi:hypothetical protein